jgi:hypothetical protein
MNISPGTLFVFNRARGAGVHLSFSKEDTSVGSIAVCDDGSIFICHTWSKLDDVIIVKDHNEKMVNR